MDDFRYSLKRRRLERQLQVPTNLRRNAAIAAASEKSYGRQSTTISAESSDVLLRWMGTSDPVNNDIPETFKQEGKEWTTFTDDTTGGTSQAGNQTGQTAQPISVPRHFFTTRPLPRPSCSTSLPLLLRETIGFWRTRSINWSEMVCGKDANDSCAKDVAVEPGQVSHAISAVVLDFETTGFSPFHDHIVEVGCVEVCWTPPHRSAQPPLRGATGEVIYGDDNILSGTWSRGQRRLHRFVRPPTRSIPSRAVKVHGLTAAHLQFAEHWPSVAADLVQYFGDLGGNGDGVPSTTAAPSAGFTRSIVRLPPIIAHNASFDARFLEVHLSRCGYDVVWHPRYPITCTQSWIRSIAPHHRYDLNSACSLLSVEEVVDRGSAHHNALEDAMLTARLFLSMCTWWTAEAEVPRACLSTCSGCE